MKNARILGYSLRCFNDHFSLNFCRLPTIEPIKKKHTTLTAINTYFDEYETILYKYSNTAKIPLIIWKLNDPWILNSFKGMIC